MSATVYIAGPMTGFANLNYDAFGEAEKALKDMALSWGLDLTVINPAKFFGGRQDLPYSKYMEEARANVAKADVVVLLDGWEKSKGVTYELEIAYASERKPKVVSYEEYTGRVSPQNEPDDMAVLPEEDDGLGFGPCGYQPCDCNTVRDCDEHTDIFPKESPLVEAERLVMGDRQSSYAHPQQDFRTTGRQWAALLENWLKSEEGWEIDIPDIPPRIVALCMAALKASREAQKPNHDNRVDGPGYWLCADRIVEDY